MNITLGAFQAIKAKNPNAIAWKDTLPYAWADPCPRELEFNTKDPVWGDANLRKAVALIIDRTSNIKIAYQGTTTPSSTIFVQYGGMQPFIDAIAKAGLAYDAVGHVADGQKLIEAAGYKKNSSGIYEKDGKTLDLPILVVNDTQEYILSNNELVEQFQKAGINASSQPVNGATSQNANQTGNFVAQWAWNMCGSVSEPWYSLNTENVTFLKPMGQIASGDWGRWDTDGAKAYKYLYDEAPVIPLVQAEKLVPFDTTYWTNWPSASNPYTIPTTWWNNTFNILLNLHKATPKS